MRPIIGLVSGTYNRIDLLQKMVQSFRDNLPETIPYTITLVDGGSTDGTLDWIRAQSDIQLIADGKLMGAISAFTRGAFATDAQYIVIANDDIVFGEDSILAAYIHLEENLGCGAVAFKDNRPIPGYVDDTTFKTLRMPARQNDRPASVIYAQVGMFRKWLGDVCDWWGANTTMREAQTYGGDNNLSAHVWAKGYRVEEVDGCYVIDYVVEDELRRINRASGEIANMGDSEIYYRQWNSAYNGPTIPPRPILPQQDTPAVRVLYLPVYEPGWTIQKTQKRGLRDALIQAKTPKGWGLSVYEIDYLSIPPKQLEDELLHAAGSFQPRLILTQIQAPSPLTANILSRLRSYHPRASLINWNGDYWPGGLTSPEMLHLLRYVDLQLTVNASVLDKYQEQGIAAAYWQIGYEEAGDDLPQMPVHDVVFLGSFNNPKRLPLLEALKEMSDGGVNVGVYQPGDASATLYDFAKGKALYHAAKIAIGSNEYPDGYGFFSNRVFQAMAAGGCIYFQQKVPGMKELTGLLPGTHFVEWSDYADLRAQVRYFLDPANEADRRRIADAGTRFVHQFHSFEARVQELFGLMKEHLQPYQDPQANAIHLRYIGRMAEGFGIPSRTNERLHYQYEPGKLLLVDKLDAPYFLAQPELWEMAE